MNTIAPASKFERDDLLLSTTSAVELSVDLTRFPDSFIEVRYGANAGGNIKLQSSSDGNPTFAADITDSIEAADVTGGVVHYNISALRCKWVIVIAPATAGTTVRLQA